jgi:hypothetical protein
MQPVDPVFENILSQQNSNNQDESIWTKYHVEVTIQSNKWVLVYSTDLAFRHLLSGQYVSIISGGIPINPPSPTWFGVH